MRRRRRAASAVTRAGLLALRRGAAIEKTRHIVPYAGATWEIDVFAGENAGLILAEVELPHENAPLELPPFVGAEVTGRTQYYNSSLVARPYRTWAPAYAGPLSRSRAS